MRADILSQFVDQRIEISGAFDKMTQVNRSGRFIYTALLQDVFAYNDGKEYDVGHVWVQHAEELKPLRLLPGERIQCNCRVKQYKKHLDMPNQDGFTTEIKYSLIYPTEIEVLNRVEQEPELVAPQPEAQEASQPNAVSVVNPVELVLEVRRVAKLAGGFDSLQQLIEALR